MRNEDRMVQPSQLLRSSSKYIDANNLFNFSDPVVFNISHNFQDVVIDTNEGHKSSFVLQNRLNNKLQTSLDLKIPSDIIDMRKQDRRKHSNYQRKMVSLKPRTAQELRTSESWADEVGSTASDLFQHQSRNSDSGSHRHGRKNGAPLTSTISSLITTSTNQMSPSNNVHNTPIQILLANGQLIQIPNLQSLLAAAQVILQQQSQQQNSSNISNVQKNLIGNINANAVLKDNNLNIQQSNFISPIVNRDSTSQKNDNSLNIKTDNTDQFSNHLGSNNGKSNFQMFNNSCEDQLYEESKCSLSCDDSPTIASTLAAMPKDDNSSICCGTTVDGINLDEIRDFARFFKLRRLALGLTQTQVGQSLSAAKGPAYSQSAICRFEKLDITPKSAAKIKPVLEKWMKDAERKYADRPSFLSRLRHGSQTYADLVDELNSKKRKRRTSFSPQALDVLSKAFERNTHPSGAEMTTLSHNLHYDREVIRVWFCNKRQALKNIMKKDASRSTSPASSESIRNRGDICSSPSTTLSSPNLQHQMTFVKDELASNNPHYDGISSIVNDSPPDFSHRMMMASSNLTDERRHYILNENVCSADVKPAIDVKDFFSGLAPNNMQLTFADAVMEVTGESNTTRNSSIRNHRNNFVENQRLSIGANKLAIHDECLLNHIANCHSDSSRNTNRLSDRFSCASSINPCRMVYKNN